LTTGLHRELAEFDGRDTACLENIHARFCRDSAYCAELVKLAGSGEPTLCSGATWLLRHHVEQGQQLSVELTIRLARQLDMLEGWQAVLHILQTIRSLDIQPDQAEIWVEFSNRHLNHKRPFLRAWSLDALCALAHRHQAFRKRALAALEIADQDPAASVRARARNLRRSA